MGHNRYENLTMEEVEESKDFVVRTNHISNLLSEGPLVGLAGVLNLCLIPLQKPKYDRNPRQHLSNDFTPGKSYVLVLRS